MEGIDALEAGPQLSRHPTPYLPEDPSPPPDGSALWSRLTIALGMMGMRRCDLGAVLQRLAEGLGDCRRQREKI